GAVPSTTVPSGSNTPFANQGPAGTAASSAGSGQSSNGATSAQPAPGQNGAPSSLAPLPTGIVGQPTKVVTTGTIDLALGHNPLDPAVTRLTTIAIGAGGYVA